MVKYRSVRYIFYVVVKFINLRFIIRIKLIPSDIHERGQKRGVLFKLKKMSRVLWATAKSIYELHFVLRK